MKKKIRYISLLLLPVLLSGLGAFMSCSKDEFNTDQAYRLEFSTDTVLFDTVFTTVGSATSSLVIRNTTNKKINISSVKLARGKASPFRLNIDGLATEEFDNLEIGANDSSFIFVKVTIDPNNADNPLVQTDSVVFVTNGNIQDVKLVAWGQDAYFHHSAVISGDTTFPANKPHVIYGKLTALTGSVLNLTAGTRLYFHNGSSLEIRKGASISVAGTLESPVIFSADRLEDYYLDKPGLWDGIWLKNGSINNSFTYAEIYNAKVGIQADSCGLTGGEPLRLHNCLIHNMTNFGLRATKSQIVATNCQVTNCGGNTVSIENGGNYEFRNCTFANYWSSSSRRYPALSLSNYTYDTSGVIKVFSALTGAYFGNCIITGNQADEIELLKVDDVDFNFLFDRCLVQWTEKQEFASGFNKCIYNKEVKFIDPMINNFQLDTLSAAKDSAWVSIINLSPTDITHDRKGISRLVDVQPDLGAYERVEKR